MGERFPEAFLSFDPQQLDAVAAQGFSAATSYVATVGRCEATVLRVTCIIVGSDDLGPFWAWSTQTPFRIDIGDADTILAVV